VLISFIVYTAKTVHKTAMHRSRMVTFMKEWWEETQIKGSEHYGFAQ
jgi:hypothetical protein